MARICVGVDGRLLRRTLGTARVRTRQACGRGFSGIGLERRVADMASAVVVIAGDGDDDAARFKQLEYRGPWMTAASCAIVPFASSADHETRPTKELGGYVYVGSLTDRCLFFSSLFCEHQSRQPCGLPNTRQSTVMA